MSAGHAADLVDVKLLGLPLDAYRLAAEHHDELFREFRLVLAREPGPGHEVPARLFELMEELDRDFSSFTAGTVADLNEAVEQGADTVDLVFTVPRAVRDASVRLAQLLAEADEYCRHGELLTLAPPAGSIAFRNWYLNEFVAQIDGAAPTRFEE